MRFKKGSKVEVMNKEVPASWCVGEIISGNGNAYNVRYNGYEAVEKVSRRFIRPFPPAICSQNWVTGDIVEVFDENSWKTATVSKILKGCQLLVRPHGFSHEIRTQKTNVRARKSWRDGQWISVGKISGGNGVEPKICHKKDDCSLVYNGARLSNLKRSSPFCSSLIEAKKVKLVEKDGSQSQRHVSHHSIEKVDAFEGNEYMQASLNNCLNGNYETKKRKIYGIGRRILEPNEFDTDLCSVGSCSVPSDDPNKLSSHNDADDLCSDGESFNTSRVEHEVAAHVHRLELHAYRSTLEALYASGPLSWEKEALLTNLRINLNISNDEHLTELRQLISSGVN
ncbi:hypothetical protein R6Q59_030977 [Mikania micrantha]